MRTKEIRIPNAKTVKAMRKADEGKGKRIVSAHKLFDDLGIPQYRQSVASKEK
jgi:hypothetical protein